MEKASEANDSNSSTRVSICAFLQCHLLKSRNSAKVFQNGLSLILFILSLNFRVLQTDRFGCLRAAPCHPWIPFQDLTCLQKRL